MNKPDRIATMAYQIIAGNALHVLPTRRRRLAQTCVTSPPYWGLRDYGDPGQEWPAVEFHLALGGVDVPVVVPAMTAPLGLEPTPIAYVAHLVAIFREVRRVLADDGTLWLNLGDTYASDTKGSGGSGDRSTKQTTQLGAYHAARKVEHGMKPKDLVGVPWLVAYALRSDGWYLRSDIIWHKRNPMPEPVTDRPTKGHEYLFLLAKSEQYQCDMSAVRSAQSTTSHGGSRPQCGGKLAVLQPTGQGNLGMVAGTRGRNKRTVWSITSQPYKSPIGQHFAQMPPKLVEPCILAGSRRGDLVLDPFAGSGTVGQVAIEHGRRFVGIELMPDHVAIAIDRLDRTVERSGGITKETAKLGQQLGLLSNQGAP